MKKRYDLRVSRYRCERCNTPLDVESDGFHWFSGPDDPSFWCPACEDLPAATIVGDPAADLPAQLQLPKAFVLRPVPQVKPDEAAKAALLYRPFSTRSFLRQYLDWTQAAGAPHVCRLASSLDFHAGLDPDTRTYTNELVYQISDTCGDAPCQFLRGGALKPEEIECWTLRQLCDVRGRFGLCDTGDEAMVLQQFLLIAGGEHYPMLIPQASIHRGRRRPDFTCFVPVSAYQYRKLVVLIDRPGKPPEKCKEEEEEYSTAGYLVHRMLVDRSESYFKLARSLALWLEGL